MPSVRRVEYASRIALVLTWSDSASSDSDGQRSPALSPSASMRRSIATIDLGGPIVAGHLYTIGGGSWATGVSASLALGSDTIVYSDTRLGPRTRPVVAGRIGAGPLAYERAEASSTTLSGAITGVSASPHRLLDVIGELYLDTGGYTAEQLRDYTHLKARVHGAYDLTPNPAARRYYRGVMAELLQSYDPFTSARVLFFLRLATAATGSGGWYRPVCPRFSIHSPPARWSRRNS